MPVTRSPLSTHSQIFTAPPLPAMALEARPRSAVPLLRMPLPRRGPRSGRNLPRVAPCVRPEDGVLCIVFFLGGQCPPRAALPRGRPLSRPASRHELDLCGRSRLQRLIYPLRLPPLVRARKDAKRCIDELRQRKIEQYRRAYPQIMRVLRPKLLTDIPVASDSIKYLHVLLQCQACFLLVDHYETHGDSKETRAIRSLAESSLKALSSVDSHRGALLHFCEYSQLPRGWKVPELPRLEIEMQPELRDGDTGKRIAELEGLCGRDRAGWLRRPVKHAEERITVPGRYGASVRLTWR